MSIIPNSDPYTGPSFSFRNRLFRVAWNIAYVLFFRFSPRPMHAWRALVLRAFGAKLGNHVHIYPKARVWAPWNLELGDNVGIADGVILYNMDQIKIGSFSVISQGAHLCGGSHDYNSTNFQLVARPIIIQEHVWVCAEAFITLGATVPEGAVVGARAVVTKPLHEPWTVYAGNPCEKVKRRSRPSR